MILNKVEAFITFLDEKQIAYCIIGGIAILLYGGRASTIDFDLYILTEDLQRLSDVLSKNKIPFQKLGDFQLKVDYQGLSIDILHGDTRYAPEVFKRTKQLPLGRKKVHVASPEDLIIMKTSADRPIDRRDVEELRELFNDQLDEDLIQRTLHSFRGNDP